MAGLRPQVSKARDLGHRGGVPLTCSPPGSNLCLLVGSCLTASPLVNNQPNAPFWR